MSNGREGRQEKEKIQKEGGKKKKKINWSIKKAVSGKIKGRKTLCLLPAGKHEGERGDADGSKKRCTSHRSDFDLWGTTRQVEGSKTSRREGPNEKGGKRGTGEIEKGL